MKKHHLVWSIIKTFSFDVKYTYLLLSVAVLQSKNETDRFYDERFLKIHTLDCIGKRDTRKNELPTFLQLN